MVKVFKPVFLFSLAIISFSCSEDIKTFKASKKRIVESIFASGYVKSQDQYISYPLVSGEIEEIYVKEGDMVQVGQPLIKIKNRVQDLSRRNADLFAKFNKVENNLGKIQEMEKLIILAKEKLSLDSSIYFRQKALWEKNIGTKIELESKFLNYKNAKASYTSTIQNLNDFKRQLELNAEQSKNNLSISSELEDNYIIRSKVDGQILQINREKGEMVGPQIPLLSIGNTDEFKLEMQIDENDIFDLALGQKTYVKISSLPDTILMAKISSINPIMNERTKTFQVEARFEENPPKMFSNLSFEANIEIKSKEMALVIPRNLIFQDSLVLTKEEKTLPIKIGLRNFEYAEVISGLDENTELIIPEK